MNSIYYLVPMLMAMVVSLIIVRVGAGQCACFRTFVNSDGNRCTLPGVPKNRASFRARP